MKGGVQLSLKPNNRIEWNTRRHDTEHVDKYHISWARKITRSKRNIEAQNQKRYNYLEFASWASCCGPSFGACGGSPCCTSAAACGSSCGYSCGCFCGCSCSFWKAILASASGWIARYWVYTRAFVCHFTSKKLDRIVRRQFKNRSQIYGRPV